MAKELGERVKLQSPVYRIDQSGDMVEVETLNKETYTVRGTLEPQREPEGPFHRSKLSGELIFSAHTGLQPSAPLSVY